MNQLPISKQDAVAFFRFQVISPLFNAKRGFIVETAKEIAAKEHNDVVNQKLVTFSLRTIYNYYSNYKKYGFDGLKPKTRCDKGHHPQIDPEIISEIIALKKELPIRSSAKIISMLTISGKIEKGLLRERTVNRILNQYGYTNQVLIKNKRIYAKHEKDKINEMWQSDVMSSFYIPDGNGGKKMAYLIGMIDDNSRKDMHSEFYLDSTLSRLEDTLRKAVIKHGIPLSIYVDNGKIFISDQFKLICAKLGIRLRFATPRNCSGKGYVKIYIM